MPVQQIKFENFETPSGENMNKHIFSMLKFKKSYSKYKGKA